MFYVSWNKNTTPCSIVCNDEYTVEQVVDMLEKEMLSFKVTNMFHMLVPRDFGLGYKGYKFWIDGK
jgi:hypothetical protein